MNALKELIQFTSPAPVQMSHYFDIARKFADAQPIVTVCQAGFSDAHTAVVFLAASARIRFIGWSDGASRLDIDFLSRKFANRSEVIFGELSTTIRDFFATRPNVRCDIVVIDGPHSYNGVLWALADLMLFSQPSAPVFFGDCYNADVAKALNESVKQGSLVEVQRYVWGENRSLASGYCVGAMPTVHPAEPFDGCPLAQPIPTSRKVVFTTLVAPAWPKGISNDYMYMLNLWVHSIRASGIPNDKILVMYVNETTEYPAAMATLRALNVSTLKIPSRVSTTGIERYKYSMSKFWVWKLSDYDQVAFFDLDFAFLRSPSGVFEECGNNATFCAGPSIDQRELNAGFFVIVPNETHYQLLLPMDGPYVDQHVLNQVYLPGTWKRLREDFNWVIYLNQERVRAIRENRCLIGIHAKWFELVRDVKEPHFAWNYFNYTTLVGS